MNIVFIGAGNLATQLAQELKKQSYNILQVYSRTSESAKTLANKIGAEYTTDLKTITNTADLYIFSVKDSSLPDLIPQIKPNNGIWIHTAGSIDMNIFKRNSNRYGVIYPFQTFSKNRNISFKEIPIYIEADSESTLKDLEKISCTLSDKVTHLSSDKRQYLHLTGVFACNFTNHMYTISEQILEDQGIPFESILPLIEETTLKIHSLKPKDAQTGPAIRYDENVINKHLSLIEDPDLKKIYQLLSQNIHKTNTIK